jgi:hypothetical protein
MWDMGPSDARASSGTSFYHGRKLASQSGRHLAGADIEVEDEDSVPAYAINELNLIAEGDDVQGNGVFDPPGTLPNVHADAGVMAGRFAWPGYLARERVFQKSEVIDVTTGRPLVYVNGGAVAMDSAAQIAFLERGAYSAPRPVISAAGERNLRSRSTVNVRQNPIPIGYLGEATTAPAAAPANPLVVVGAVAAFGLALGAVYGLLSR